jgi:hypothetical protein
MDPSSASREGNAEMQSDCSILKRTAVTLILLFLCSGCSDDAVDVRDGGPLDKLEITLLAGSVVADRLSPNFENPGSYVIEAAFSLRVRNANSADTIYGLLVPSAELYFSPTDTLLGTIDFDDAPIAALAPGAVDTIDVEEICGHLNVGEAHCNLPLDCRITMIDRAGDIRRTETDLVLICFP